MTKERLLYLKLMDILHGTVDIEDYEDIMYQVKSAIEEVYGYGSTEHE
jgi:hypothetical protein